MSAIERKHQSQPTGVQGFVRRLNRAMQWWSFQNAEAITQKKLGDLVGAELGRAKPVDQGDVSGWFNGVLPRLPMLEAVARALGVRAGWLAFGEEPMLPATVGAAGLRVAEAPDIEYRERERTLAEEAVRDLPEGKRAAGPPAKKKKPAAKTRGA